MPVEVSYLEPSREGGAMTVHKETIDEGISIDVTEDGLHVTDANHLHVASFRDYTRARVLPEDEPLRGEVDTKATDECHLVIVVSEDVGKLINEGDFVNLRVTGNRADPF